MGTAFDKAPEKPEWQDYKCNHDKQELRAHTLSNGVIQIKFQCLMCGCPVGTALKHKDAFDKYGVTPTSLPQWDVQLYNHKSVEYEQRWRTYHAECEAWSARRTEQWWINYNKYLQSEEWHKKRELVMRRAKAWCEGCGLNPATQVHHLTYDHVGNEFLWELVAVCDDCHDRVHPVE